MLDDEVPENLVTFECRACAVSLDSTEVNIDHEGEVLCTSCAITCDHCGFTADSDFDWNMVDQRYNWCNACAMDDANWCESCEEYTTDAVYFVPDVGSYWCEHCCTENATWCESCDAYYCNGCNECSSRTIHDYSYKPDPIFHTISKDSRLYFGLELETEAGNGGVRDAAEYASQLEQSELAYLKHDGSLNYGFEIVTHPMTYEFLNEEAGQFWDVLETLRGNYNMKSWGTGTCGVHIHISRTGFNGGAHMHRFLNLVYSNQDFYQAIAGRSSSRWAKFDDCEVTQRVYDDWGNRTWRSYRSFKNKIDNNRHSDRYSAVNTQNDSTLEMRIFRGTLKKAKVKSYLDLAHASVEYTRTLSIQDVKDGALNTQNFMKYIYSKPELYSTLIGYMNDLNLNSIWLTRQQQQEMSN